MPDILIRGINDDTKKSLEVLAASVGVSLNKICIWILDEAAMPYEELYKALVERADEVNRASDAKRIVIRGGTVPHPNSITKPFPKVYNEYILDPHDDE